MPKSYDEDLRVRVIAARRSGMEVEEVSKLFSVSRDCVYRWTARHDETGETKARGRGGRKKSKITDEEKFRKFAEAHTYSTLEQMRMSMEEEVSIMTISRMLRKLGITRKKRPMAILKEMK
jgi:transposase